MTVLGQKTARVVTAAVLSIAVAACGGGGADATSPAPVVSTAPPVVIAPPDEPVIQETIEGVATPSSVSVVTATNAT